ncbi:serine protease 33-like [Corythoichthys intestinalis]|uniref:serine protease 33-like n=1 Tax=Corythoichthys intestinalis TaxID=161448 RepID=UPI0025A54705|nr:serine protease 33-like [Corythoichthys intestinalis]
MNVLKLTLLLLLLLKECRAQLDVCGQAPLNKGPVSGQAAPVGAWPWLVSLQFSGHHFCGGSLISRQWVLTAMRCIVDSPQVITVILGRQRQDGPNPHEVAKTVAKVIRHPDYDPTTFKNDVALLLLSTPVIYTDFIKPVCLAEASSTFFDGTESWVTEWGDIGFNVSQPSGQDLKGMKVPVLGNRQCFCDYSGLIEITDNMICSGLREGGKGNCQVDSGSPMVTKQGPVWIQIGVVSFGAGCVLQEFPGIYARVSRYQEWISNQISNQTGVDDLPGFVRFISTGTDPDLKVSCPDLPPPLITTSSPTGSTASTASTPPTSATTTNAPIVIEL